MNPADFLQILERALWSSVPVMGVAAAATLVLRRCSAALRHRVWTVAVVTLLVIPFMGMLTVPLQPMSVLRVPTFLSVEGLPRAVEEPLPIGHGAGPAPGVYSRTADDRPVEPTLVLGPGTLFAVVWLLGAMIFTIVLVRRLRQVFILIRRADEVEEPRVMRLYGRLYRDLGIRRPVRLLVGPPGSMPLTWGLSRHLIVIPETALRWPERRLEALLRHEMAHVERGDVRIQLLVEVVRILYWVNPLVWYAAGRMVVEREQASDDRAVSGAMQPVDYAAELLHIAASIARRRPTVAVAMAAGGGPSLLAVRIRAILDPGRSRVAPSVPLTVALTALFLILSAATVGQRSAETDGREHRSAPEMSADAPTVSNAAKGTNASHTSERRRQSSVVPAPSPECLDRNLRGTNSNRNTEKGGLEKSASWRTPLCSGRLLLAGRLQSAPGSDRIVEISRGGFLRIEHRDGSSMYVLELRSGGDGLAFSGRVNAKNLDPETARDFIDVMVPAIERFTGLELLP